MSRKPPKTPQEKKAQSLRRDCRNTYGNNDKAARKAVPLRKAQASRKVRHKDNQAVSLIPQMDEAEVDLVESTVRHAINRVGGWTKSPDEPLGKIVAWSAEARAQRVGSKQRRRLRKQG